MTKNTKKNPIPLWKRIRFKLIFAFLIPVVFIIVLGFVSYQKATTQIIATYRDSVDQTVSMMNQYLTLSFDTVQSNYKGYMNEDTLKQYLNGLYDNDATTLYNTPNTYEDTFIKAVTTDALLSNIYVLSDKSGRSLPRKRRRPVLKCVPGKLPGADFICGQGKILPFRQPVRGRCKAWHGFLQIQCPPRQIFLQRSGDPDH